MRVFCPLTQDETGLAVVMGHEIAHVVAKHGEERMSQALMAQMGGMALDLALQNRRRKPEACGFRPMAGFPGRGYPAVFPRVHENEADRLGLIFMAMAGYDPSRAVTFWQKMAAQSKTKQTFEFLSTHPSDATRIAKLKQALPEARRYYGK